MTSTMLSIEQIVFKMRCNSSIYIGKTWVANLIENGVELRRRNSSRRDEGTLIIQVFHDGRAWMNLGTIHTYTGRNGFRELWMKYFTSIDASSWKYKGKRKPVLLTAEGEQWLGKNVESLKGESFNKRMLLQWKV